ncbi:MAG: hypothetical protein ABW252_15370 [Polyangiales bacterium]
MAATPERRVVGNILVDLVKFLKNHEAQHGPVELGAEARALLAGRVVMSGWYPLGLFHELLAVLDRLVVKGSERRALELGAAGGVAMRGVKKTYLVPGDPRQSVIAMRHAWRTHYDFGVVSYEDGEDDVQFRIDGYPDIPMVHALMTAGWGISAARAAGSETSLARIVERPWRDGARDFVYRIRL